MKHVVDGKPDDLGDKIEWIDKGQFYHLSVNDSLNRCVACNKPIEYDKINRFNCHKCQLRKPPEKQQWPEGMNP